MILPFGSVVPDTRNAVFIADSADVVGDVTLKEGSSVWFGAVLRGDYAPVTLGKNSNVQDNAVVHTDIDRPTVIGDNVTIGHSAVVHGCTLGDNVLVGMHATILNGAVVGQNCIIAAGALVLENAVIPDGSLVVGSPARVLRPVSEAQLEFFAESADSYHRHAAEYAAAQRELHRQKDE